MALFEKKFCDLCGEKVNLVTRLSLSDGFLCSDCKKKLSCWSDGWKHKTIADAKNHIAAREQNKQKYAQFNKTAEAGKNGELKVDMNAGTFFIAAGSDYTNDKNPEIFSFSQLTGYRIDENFTSYSSTDSDGDGIPDYRDNFNNKTGVANNNVNMNAGQDFAPQTALPYIKRETTDYDSATGMLKKLSSLAVVLTVNHPYISEIKFSIESSFLGNNPALIINAYNQAVAVMQLCDRMTGNTPNAGFAGGMNSMGGFQQPMNNMGGYPQQPMNNMGGYPQQPMNNMGGYPQQPAGNMGGYPQQPAGNMGGYPQQPMNNMGGYPQQQPVNNMGGFPQQQPMNNMGGFQPGAAAFCPNCGAQVAPGTVFCPNCGNKMN